MFYYVSGLVAHIEPSLAVIDCGGVGYACRTTSYTLGSIQQGKQAKLFTYLNVREDAMELFGFATTEELNLFQKLISVTGVGPKAALSILSANSPANLALAIITGDEKPLTMAQGIGKKIAQRIILELKDKLGGAAMELDFSAGSAPVPVQSGSNAALAHAALQELGYSPAEINAALKGVDPQATTEEMVRYALRAMVMKG